MTDTRTTVTAFFASYRAAFEGADATAIVDHFAFPCHVTGEAREVTLTALASRGEGLRMVEQLLVSRLLRASALTNEYRDAATAGRFGGCAK